VDMGQAYNVNQDWVVVHFVVAHFNDTPSKTLNHEPHKVP